MSRARSGHAVDHDDYSDGMGEDYPSYNYDDEEEYDEQGEADSPVSHSVTVVDKTTASKAAQVTEREQALAAQRANQAEVSVRHAEAEKQRQALLVELEAAGIVSPPGLSNEQLEAFLHNVRIREAKFEAEKREAAERDAIRKAEHDLVTQNQRGDDDVEGIPVRPVFCIPYNVWFEVFQWLTPIDITSLGSSAWLLHEMATNDEIWRGIIKRRKLIYAGPLSNNLYSVCFSTNPRAMQIGPIFFSLDRSPAPFRWSALWSFRYLMIQLRFGELDRQYYEHHPKHARQKTSRPSDIVMGEKVMMWKTMYRAGAYADLFHNEDTDPKVKEYARLIVNLLGKMGSTALKIFESIDFTAFSKKQAEAYGIPSTPDEIARLRSQCISASLDSSEENEQDLTQAKRFFFKGRDIVSQKTTSSGAQKGSPNDYHRIGMLLMANPYLRSEYDLPELNGEEKILEMRLRNARLDPKDYFYGTRKRRAFQMERLLEREARMKNH